MVFAMKTLVLWVFVFGSLWGRFSAIVPDSTDFAGPEKEEIQHVEIDWTRQGKDKKGTSFFQI